MILIATLAHLLTTTTPALVASDCAALFGTRETRERARDARERRALQIIETPYAIDISYEGTPWRTPVLQRVPGVRFVRVDRADKRIDTDDAALIQLTVPSANERCAAGTYRLTVDDTIEDAPIVAIVDDGVFVDAGEEPRFVGDVLPAVRLIWRSDIVIRYPRPYTPPRAPPPPPAPARSKR